MEKSRLGNGMIGIAAFIGVPSLALTGHDGMSALFVLTIAAALVLVGNYWGSIFH